MKWRYSVRTLLVAATTVAIMAGFSAASYHNELDRRKKERVPIQVVYDYGPFGGNIDADFAAALEQGTDFGLLSLHPMPYKATPDNNFHGWKVPGRISVTDNNVRNRLLAAFKGGINAAEEEGADCFDPRHGIRVRSDDKTIDFVICFDCEWVQTYVDDKRKESFTCSYTPQPEFDAILTSAGVELAPVE